MSSFVVPDVEEIGGMSPADLEACLRVFDGERRRLDAQIATFVNRVEVTGAFVGDHHRTEPKSAGAPTSTPPAQSHPNTPTRTTTLRDLTPPASETSRSPPPPPPWKRSRSLKGSDDIQVKGGHGRGDVDRVVGCATGWHNHLRHDVDLGESRVP